MRWPSYVAAASVLVASAAAQAAAPRVKADVTPEVVAPGQSFQVQVEATSDEPGGVTKVEMPTPPGFKKLGERKTTTSSVVINGNGAQRRQGLSVVYTFSSDKVGSVKLGPITVEAGGQSYRAQGPRVEVSRSAPPPAPARRSQDPFAGLFGSFGFDSDPFTFDPPQPRVDPSLGLPKALGETVFFHAKTNTRDLVYGQRLVFDVLEYVEEGLRGVDYATVHEAAVDDFLSTPVEVRHSPRSLGLAQVGNKIFSVRLFRRWLLTPLKTGTLSIGALGVEIPTHSGKNVLRSSEELKVVVREPPANGRPNGYQMGTVGTYEIKVDPLPDTLTTGERTALQIHVTGAGLPPSKLLFRDFGDTLRFSEPEISDRENGPPAGTLPGVDHVDPLAGTTTRTFRYLLEARAPGSIVLGEVSLPTYLPKEQRYTVTSAALGTLTVTGVAKVDDSDGPRDAHQRVALDLGAPIDELSGAAPVATQMPAAAYAVPVAVPLLGWLAAWLRAGLLARRQRPQAAPDLRARVDQALEDGALTSFVSLLAEHVLGERRPREEWPVALREAGKSADEVDEFLRFADQVDEARYAPSQDSGDLPDRAKSWRRRWM